MGAVDRKLSGTTSDSTTSTGSGNAARIKLGGRRKDVDVFYDVSGAANVTVEVSTDGSTWREFHVESPGSAGKDVLQFSTAYAYARVYVDTNLNTVEIAGA